MNPVLLRSGRRNSLELEAEAEQAWRAAGTSCNEEPAKEPSKTSQSQPRKGRRRSISGNPSGSADRRARRGSVHGDGSEVIPKKQQDTATWLRRRSMDVSAMSADERLHLGLVELATPFLKAKFRECIAKGDKAQVQKYMIDIGADAVDERDKKGRTPFMTACSADVPHIAQLFLNRGCDTDARDDNGQTAWDIAIRMGHVATFDTLAELARARIVTSEGSATWQFRYPKLANEFEAQQWRRDECVGNSQPWLRLSGRLFAAQLASRPVWELLITEHGRDATALDAGYACEVQR